MSEFYIKPLIVICSFFKDAFDNYKLTSRGIFISNIVFSILMSVFCGFIVGTFIFVISSEVFKFQPFYPGYVILSCGFFVELIQLNIILILRHEKVFFPEIYFNCVLMIFVIVKEKLIVRQFIKAILLISTYFIFLNVIFISFYGIDLYSIGYVGVLLGVSVIIPIFIMSKEPISSFRNSVKVMLVQLILIIIYFGLVLIIIWFGNSSVDINSSIINILGLIFTLQSISSSFRNSYKLFIIEFEDTISQFWSNLKPEYGFTKYQEKVVKIRNDLVKITKLIKKEWELGHRFKIIKFFLILLFIIIFYFVLIRFLDSKSLQLIVSKGFHQMATFWRLLFKGNKDIADKGLILLSISMYCIYLLVKYVRNKREGNSYIENIRAILLCLFIFFPILGLLPIFDLMSCIYISGIILLLTIIFSKKLGL